MSLSGRWPRATASPHPRPSPFLEARSNRPSVTPDQRTLVVCSRLNNALYSYSLPDLKLLGGAYLSRRGAAWVTVTPDGKKAYVADPVGNNSLVVDIPSMKEVAKIAVGQVPKRNYTTARESSPYAGGHATPPKSIRSRRSPAGPWRRAARNRCG